MGCLNDDVNTDLITLYQSRMGFDLDDRNFVYADIHLMRNLRMLDKAPDWLVSMIWFSHHANSGIVAFQPSGILIMGLTRFKDYYDDFGNVQYSFSGHNMYIPESEIKSLTLTKQQKYSTVLIQTRYQMAQFIIPSFLVSRPFQKINYENLPKLVSNLK